MAVYLICLYFLLFVQDANSNENYHLLLNPSTSATSEKTDLPFTEKEALALLKQNSIRWKQSLETISAAEAKLQQAKAAFLPHFSVGIREIIGRVNLLQYGIVTGTPLNYFSFGSTSLQLTYSLLDPALSKQGEAANSYAKSSHYSTESTQDDLIYYLLCQYSVAQKWQSLVKNRRASVQNMEKLKQLAEEKLYSEVGIDLDVKRVETRLAMVQIKEFDSIGNFEKAKRDLAALLGIDPIYRPMEPIDHIIPLSFDPSQISIQEVIDNRADRQATHYITEAAENIVKMEEKHQWPKLDFLGEAGIAGSTVFDGSSNGLVGTAGIFLNIPIYTGNLITGKIAEARANKTRAEYQEDQLIIDVKNQVQGSLYQYTLSQKALAASQKSIELATDELRLANQRFELGAGGNFDVIASQMNFAQAQDDLTEAWFNYHQATLQFLKVTNKLRTYAESLQR